MARELGREKAHGPQSLEKQRIVCYRKQHRWLKLHWMEFDFCNPMLRAAHDEDFRLRGECQGQEAGSVEAHRLPEYGSISPVLEQCKKGRDRRGV